MSSWNITSFVPTPLHSLTGNAFPISKNVTFFKNWPFYIEFTLHFKCIQFSIKLMVYGQGQRQILINLNIAMFAWIHLSECLSLSLVVKPYQNLVFSLFSPKKWWHRKTRITTFINAKLKKSDDQTNIVKYRVAAEYRIILKLIFRRIIILKFMVLRQFYIKNVFNNL